MEFIKPKYWHDADSMWDLNTDAFDLDNTPRGTVRVGSDNFLLATGDIPKGVLGGMVAACSADWESKNGTHLMVPLGLYNKNSEGAPYTNNSAIGSGKVAIYMHGGTFLLYLFETNLTATTGFNNIKTLSTSYAPGKLLYCSPFSLLTDDLPSASGAPAGSDFVCAIVSATPTTTTQEMGIKLVL